MDQFNVKETVGYIVTKTGNKLFNHLLELLTDYEITPEQWGLLNVLWENDGLNQKELAERMFKDKTNLTRMIDRLEEKGFVSRQTHPADRRAFQIFLTAKGDSLKETLIPIVTSAESSYLHGFTDEEIQVTKRVLKQIAQNISEQHKKEK